MVSLTRPPWGTSGPAVWGYPGVLLAAACFGTLGLFSRIFYDNGGEPLTLLFLRFLGIAPVLLLFVLLRERRLPPPRATIVGLSLGLVQFVSAFALLEAFSRAPVALVILLFYVNPLIATLGGALLFRERFTAKHAVFLTAGMAGVALTVTIPGSATSLGIALGLIAGIGAGVLIVAARHVMLTHSLSPLTMASLMFLLPALAVTGIAAAGAVDLELQSQAWAAAVGAVLVSGVVPILLFYAGMKAIGAGTASLLGAAEPLVTVVLGYAVLGETLTNLQLVGGLLILAAVIAVSAEGISSTRAAKAASQRP